jgi:hypothetical protein
MPEYHARVLECASEFSRASCDGARTRLEEIVDEELSDFKKLAQDIKDKARLFKRKLHA